MYEPNLKRESQILAGHSSDGKTHRVKYDEKCLDSLPAPLGNL